MLKGQRAERHRFVSLAHHFLLAVLPLRHHDSRQALAAFLDLASTCALSHSEADTALLQTLLVLDPHMGGRLPTLVERYLDDPNRAAHPLEVFRETVSDAINYRGVGDREVQGAIARIEQRFGDAEWTEAAASAEHDLAPAALSARFRSRTGLTWTEYRRDVRLDRAAAQLLVSPKSVPQVSEAVGYSAVGEFIEDFRSRFGLAPADYRARVTPRPIHPDPRHPHALARGIRPNNAGRGPVLVVDDDGGSRETVARYLRLSGCDVRTAATGTDALAAFERGTFQAALLDYHLPDMTGLQCLRELRRRGRMNVAVAIFTADWDVEDEATDIRALGAMLTSKLCEAEDIGRLVSSLCALQSGFAAREAFLA